MKRHLSVTSFLASLVLIAVPVGHAFAESRVTERAVSGAPSPLEQMHPQTGAALTAPSLEQQVVVLQQQVQSLQGQLAAIQSVLKVTPTSATLQAPAVSILSLEGTTIQSSKGITVKAATDIAVQSQAGTSIKVGTTATIQASGVTELKGAILKLNGGTKPIATVGSQVQVPGQPIGQVMTGSGTILGN